MSFWTNFQLQEQEKVCWRDIRAIVWLRKHCSFVYYQSCRTDSAVFTGAMMRRRNLPCLSLIPSLFFPAASHTSQKTGRFLDSYLPLRTNIMYQTSSQRQQWRWSSHSIHIVILLLWSWGWPGLPLWMCCFISTRLLQTTATGFRESTNSHPIITWPSHDFKKRLWVQTKKFLNRYHKPGGVKTWKALTMKYGIPSKSQW